MIPTFIQKTFAATLLILGCSAINTISAQSPAELLINQVYQKYDSIKYLTFDMKYIYSTDTLNGDFRNDVINSTYTLAGKRTFYNIGDIEMMQNDSFFISVYNKEKFIIVSDPGSNSTGNGLPLRSSIDSLLLGYTEHYTVDAIADSTTGIVTFTRADSTAQYDKFIISYDVQSYFINSIRYDFQEVETTEPDDTTLLPQTFMRKKSLTVEFSNYRIDNFSDNLYNENNYIWFEDGVCKPVSKYNGFKIYYSRSPFRSNTGAQ